MIKVLNVTKTFRKKVALDDVSFSVKRGAVHALVGPNGSGKTTIIKMIIGSYTTKEGSIDIDTNNIGYMSENGGFFGETLKGYLVIMGQLSGLSLKDSKLKAEVIITKYKLEKERKTIVGKMSSGMKKKVQLSAITISNPDLIIMDEPTANLDPYERQNFYKFLDEYIKQEGNTVLVSSHIISELDRYVDDITILDSTKIIYSGNIKGYKYKTTGNVIKTSDNKKAIELLKSMKIKASESNGYVKFPKVTAAVKKKVLVNMIDSDIEIQENNNFGIEDILRERGGK